MAHHVELRMAGIGPLQTSKSIGLLRSTPMLRARQRLLTDAERPCLFNDPGANHAIRSASAPSKLTSLCMASGHLTGSIKVLGPIDLGPTLSWSVASDSKPVPPIQSVPDWKICQFSPRRRPSLVLTGPYFAFRKPI
jgi:hypothetical protein